MGEFPRDPLVSRLKERLSYHTGVDVGDQSLYSAGGHAALEDGRPGLKVGDLGLGDGSRIHMVAKGVAASAMWRNIQSRHLDGKKDPPVSAKTLNETLQRNIQARRVVDKDNPTVAHHLHEIEDALNLIAGTRTADRFQESVTAARVARKTRTDPGSISCHYD